jgi:hypothetical protein
MKSKLKFVVILTLVAAMGIPAMAYATASKPYSSYDAWFEGTSGGCAGIYACSCSPVNNYLSATADVQYLDGTVYKWTGAYTSSATNTSQRAFVRNAPGGKYANYVNASFAARCGSGSTKAYTDYASR